MLIYQEMIQLFVNVVVKTFRIIIIVMIVENCLMIVTVL